MSRVAWVKERTAVPDEATDSENMKECHTLYFSLENWIQRSLGLPARVSLGNTIYAKASQVGGFYGRLKYLS